MDCIKTICLYLKEYISDKQFESIFYDFLNDFQNCLEEDIYLNILSTNFGFKAEKNNMESELRNYILENHKSVYEGINDAYVERLLDSGKVDAIVEVLKNRYEKRDEIVIDCSKIKTKLELISTIKQALQYPQFCGNNWDAIEDLIYDIVFPNRLIFYNWRDIEKELPKDADLLKKIFNKNNCGRCVITYVYGN